MRKIKLIKRAVPTLEGAGVSLMRVFGYNDVPLFDPFLMLDDFRNDQPDKYLAGFPWHPHRGIETITYMLKGTAEHGDSIGNSGVISVGDVQWMTAGSGIIHQEMPKPDFEGKMYGFQLWANLPASQKMMSPRYRDVKAGDIPEVISEEGAKVKLISGDYLDQQAPVRDIIIEPQFWDIRLEGKRELEIATIPGHTCLIYVFGGEVICEGESITEHQVALFEDGDKIKLRSGSEGFRLLYLSGKPLGEPVSWRGPIVMNTKEEIKLAFQELNERTFIKS